MKIIISSLYNVCMVVYLSLIPSHANYCGFHLPSLFPHLHFWCHWQLDVAYITDYMDSFISHQIVVLVGLIYLLSS
jgi:hypothetical protein